MLKNKRKEQKYMGFQFRKQKKIGKYGRVNMSKSGLGFGVGNKWIRMTHSASGRKYITLNVPGTGLHFTKHLKKK